MNKKRVMSLEEKLPSVPEAIYLFRSCTGTLQYPGVENAIRHICGLMGIEVIMDPDQTCCSGYLLTCSAYLPEFSLAVTARNHALAEKKTLTSTPSAMVVTPIIVNLPTSWKTRKPGIQPIS